MPPSVHPRSGWGGPQRRSTRCCAWVGGMIVVDGTPHPARYLAWVHTVAFAEADGNRTRLGALAPTPVLKTGGPTRRPDASAREDSVQPLPSHRMLFACPWMPPR